MEEMQRILADPSVRHYAAAFAAALLIGLSKTGIAGAGVLMVPLMAGTFPAAPSSGLMLPILVAGDAFAVLWYRRSAQWRFVVRTLPWAVGGIVAGYVFLRLCADPGARWPVDDRTLRQGIGLMLLAMLVLGLWIKKPPRASATPSASASDGASALPASESVRLRLAQAVDGARAPDDGVPHTGAWIAPLIGGLAGFTTMVANAAGPVWIVYMVLLGLPKKEFLGTTAWAFLFINALKVPFSAHIGYVTAQTLGFNVTMLPALAVGSVLGIWIVPRVSQTWFNRIATGLAFVAALNLAFGQTLRDALGV